LLTINNKDQKIKQILNSLDKGNYEYYPVLVKKPSSFVSLNENVSFIFDEIFNNAGLKNEISNILYDYVITIAKDAVENAYLVLINIIDSKKRFPPLTDYGVFFCEDKEERNNFLNFIRNYHIIFKPHEINVLWFGGTKKYNDQEFLKEQTKWITTLYQT